MEKFSLVMPFVDPSHSFVHGFECGQIWEKMTNSGEFKKQLIHVSNKKQIEMLCARFHYSFIIEDYDETWCYLTAQLDPAKAN